MQTKTIQKIQKAYIKTYEEDVKIYKDIENSQGQGAFFLANTGNSRRIKPIEANLRRGEANLRRLEAIWLEFDSQP